MLCFFSSLFLVELFCVVRPSFPTDGAASFNCKYVLVYLEKSSPELLNAAKQLLIAVGFAKKGIYGIIKL